MCGITGLVDFNKRTSDDVLGRMVSTLTHRGPDDRGAEQFHLETATIGLGQTRLSIIDLSPLGRQPMHFGGLSIVFNGEIYNYMEIRKDLEKIGHTFKSTSDTEVVLHAFKEWGTVCVKRFIGMFAFVIYNKSEEKLFAFRDRAGVKPFFYYQKNNLFLFGSELKPFHEHPGFEKQIDERALISYFDFGYVPSPYTIFKNTHKLEPGHFMILDLRNNEMTLSEYWNPNNFYKKPKLAIGYDEAKSEVHKILKSAFQYRMVADVPVGIFLSGGYDSTAVAAILQKNSGKRLKTFTIGFEEGNNEAPDAKNTANYLGTDHHEYTCTSKEAQNIIPELPYYFDEPFADSSAIPTMLVSKFARESVTVALSADAGDELFAGYMSYPQLKKHHDLLNRIPDSLKPISGNIFSAAKLLTPESRPSIKHKLESISNSLNKDRYKQAADLFRYSNSLPSFYRHKILQNSNHKYRSKFFPDTAGFDNEIEIAMAVDYQSYLQNDILTKVDRATMSVSLEGREPLLDHRLLEFAARLPLNYKLDGLQTKRILKDIVHEYIPKEMMDRPKSGFSLPIYSWLRGDLSWLIDEYLSEEALQSSGMLRTGFVLQLVDQFKNNKLYYSPLIWKLLMFQMWYKKWN